MDLSKYKVESKDVLKEENIEDKSKQTVRKNLVENQQMNH